jgi:hypothetical protein
MMGVVMVEVFCAMLVMTANGGPLWIGRVDWESVCVQLIMRVRLVDQPLGRPGHPPGHMAVGGQTWPFWDREGSNRTIDGTSVSRGCLRERRLEGT